MTRRNQVNKILETNSRMIFLNELQQIIPQIPDIKFAEDIGKLIHSMPVLTSSMRTPKPIIKQWCDPLMTFHKHCSCYSLLTLR